MDSALERHLRDQIMTWVADAAARGGGWISRADLLGYRTADGHPLPLIDFSRGIRNPQSMRGTLSIVSAADGPYEDRESGDGLLHYV